MASWMQKPTAKELIGMEPDELKQKLEAGATKDDLKAATDGITELKSTLAALTDSIKSLKGNPEPIAPEPSGSGDDSLDLLSDPKKFVGQQLKPIEDAQQETRAQVQEMRARQNPKFAALFAQYGNELVEKAKAFPAAMRARDDFWTHHLRAVLGDKMLSGEIREGNFPSLIGSSTIGTNVGGSTNEPYSGMDKPVAEFLREKGVPSERAQRILSLMNQGEPISMATIGKVGNA